jgi:hypothetical protein
VDEAQRARLNAFLVGTFNRILTLEERALAGPGKGPSVREMHVIDAAAASRPRAGTPWARWRGR